MRIGALTNLAFTKYDRSEPRSLVNKLVPGYVQSMNFDIVATSPTIQVDGILIGTSASNLASQIETLKAMHRTRRVLWIDASDQYQGLCDFVRISKLTGPTIDSSKGPLIANFSLEAIALLPWGTTLLNPYNTTGVVLRDLSGVGLENVLNPLSMNCNFVLSSALQSNQGGNSQNWFSWEFIVDNQNAFSGSQSIINECENTTGWGEGGGATGATFSNDSVILKQGSYSLKESATSTSGGVVQPEYTAGSAANISTLDFIVFWFRSDFGGNPTGNLQIYIGPSGLASYFEWQYNNLNANQWYRLVVPLRNPSATSGSPSLSAIQAYAFKSYGKASSPMYVWLDEIAADIGNNIYLEFQIPDNISSIGTSAIQLLAWNGSSYVLSLEEDLYGGPSGGTQYFLDGSSGNSLYSSSDNAGRVGYAPNAIGNSGQTHGTAGSANSQVTYTTAYGSNNRVCFDLKMPPATSDSNSGSYPSDDLGNSNGSTGMSLTQAINKARLKIQVYYSNEGTTYTGF